ncbi:structural protein VP2 [Saline Natrinema sp. J7-1 virus 1]|uniref:Structural protein VP2 n=1 Tax=Saline Natrinema sp. J7-1 virus 1 TaxID=2847285 RepID=A0AAE9VQR5_9VIRU|nr:structural protein VP2 [Saline Natrinema sp. J7-1 virus 1]WBE14021.1 structural protein VP2 [Saline Natrinema sp. J7-1 virus 1]
MTERFEFATKKAADLFREENEEYLCSDDDRRLKTVALSSDTPERVLEEAAIETAATRAERDGTSQQPLEEDERDAIDFSKGRASVPWARSIKAIMRAEGVDDWLAYVDPTLSVDEHREVAKRAAHDEQGDRLDAEDSVDDKLASVEGFRSGQCNNAATHCEEGDDDACEFLIDECDIDENEVQSLLSDFDDKIPEDEIRGKWLGALRRAWTGYHNATAILEQALEDATEAIDHATAAAKAINGVRQAHGQDPIEEFEELERLQRPLVWDPTDEIVDQSDPEDVGLRDDRHLEDEDDDVDDDRRDDGQDALLEDLPDEGDDGPSREFRAAQQDGYLRQSEGNEPDEREGLGQFGARRSDTQALEDFENNE